MARQKAKHNPGTKSVTSFRFSVAMLEAIDDWQKYLDFTGPKDSPLPPNIVYKRWKSRTEFIEMMFAVFFGSFLHHQISHTQMWSALDADSYDVVFRLFSAFCRATCGVPGYHFTAKNPKRRFVISNAPGKNDYLSWRETGQFKAFVRALQLNKKNPSAVTRVAATKKVTHIAATKKNNVPRKYQRKQKTQDTKKTTRTIARIITPKQ